MTSEQYRIADGHVYQGDVLVATVQDPVKAAALVEAAKMCTEPSGVVEFTDTQIRSLGHQLDQSMSQARFEVRDQRDAVGRKAVELVGARYEAELDQAWAAVAAVTAVMDEYCTAGCCQHAEDNELKLHNNIYTVLHGTERAAAQHDGSVATRALLDAAEVIQSMHPGEVKNSVVFLRERAAGREMAPPSPGAQHGH
jgi:hypothetical protein